MEELKKMIGEFVENILTKELPRGARIDIEKIKDGVYKIKIKQVI